MRQILYTSRSLIGDNIRALDELMVQAQANNALDGITGLLWTDGNRFAQVIEGSDNALAALLDRLPADPRHREFAILQDSSVADRQFGDWSMARPANDPLFASFERRMQDQLASLGNVLSAKFSDIITRSHSTSFC